MEHVRKSGLAIIIGVAFVAAAIGLFDASSRPSAAHPQVASTPSVPVKIGFIGDSITKGPKDAKTAVEVEIAALGDNYKAVNRGVSGSTTTDWQPGHDMYDNALAEFKKHHVHTVSIMLGTNDASLYDEASPETYEKNMKTIINSLLRSGEITRVIVNYPPYVTPGSAGHDRHKSHTLLEAYIAKIDTLDDIRGVSIGDTGAYRYFKYYPDKLADGIHPTNEGYEELGRLWAEGYEKVLATTQQ